MNITIFTHDRSLFDDLKRTTDFDLTVSGLMSRGGKMAGGSPLYEFTLVVAGYGVKVAADVFSKWLFNKLDKRAERIEANGKQARVEVTEIEHCLEIKVKETHRKTVSEEPDSE